MKKTLLFALVALLLPATALAYGHHQNNNRDNGQASHKARNHNGSHGTGSGGSGSGTGNSGPPPVVIPPPVTPPVVGGIVLSNVWVTTYSNIDNTPRGSMEVDLGGHTGSLSGDCTYNNPTTIAVGGSIINGQEIDDFPYGTMFYIPDINHGGGCYFRAADFCGDGNTPQNSACHKPEQGSLQLDAYAGLNGSASCEDANTKIHTVIENPPSGLSVKQGNICP